MKHFLILALLSVCCSESWASAASDLLVFPGKPSFAGAGKHIVLLAGDEEYRSEEAMPMLARILSERHGFKCTVLFSLDATGTITPTAVTNLHGIEQLQSADLCIINLRFRELPDEQMKYFVDYVNSGKPIIGLRTSTHAFSYERNKQSAYAKYDWRSKEWPGGFGQQVLGETWVNHHGNHGKESTRGIINEENKSHRILKGVTDVWGPTDVYTVAHLPGDAQVLLWGQVLTGMKPSDPPVAGQKNNPMMPLAWVREYKGDAGKSAKVFTTTMGAAVDFQSEGLRRLVVNAAYWCLGLEERIHANSSVDPVGDYKPTWFGFGKFQPGIKPAELK